MTIKKVFFDANIILDVIVTNDKKFAEGKVKHLSLEEALKII